MHVLYWTQQYWPSIGGVEVASTRFTRDMRTRGFDFTVVTAHGNHPLPDTDEHDGVAIHRFAFLHALAQRDPAGIIAMTRALTELKRRLRPDLVHIHLSDPSALFHMRSRRAYPTPTVVAVHVAPPPVLAPDTMLREIFTSAAWITTPSRAIADDVATLVPALATRISTVYPGIDAPALAPEPLPFNPATLLCLGRVVDDKGFDLAIDALPAVRAAHPGTRLVIAGDGAARGALQSRVSERGLDGSVEFRGWVTPDDVPALLNQTTMLLVPSRWREAFGIVTLDAARMARPAVCADVGGLREAVAHEHTGLVVPPEDPAALAASVSRLLADPQWCRDLGTQARARALDCFSWTRHLDVYEALYRHAVRDGDPTSA